MTDKAKSILVGVLFLYQKGDGSMPTSVIITMIICITIIALALIGNNKN